MKGEAGHTSSARAALRWLPAATVAVTLLIYLVLIPFNAVGSGDRYRTPEVVIAVALLLALIVVANPGLITRITVGGVAFDLQARTEELAVQVKALQVAVTGLLTKWEFVHLAGLADKDHPATKRYTPELFAEVCWLDKKGFIRPRDDNKRGLNAIWQDNEGGGEFDLKAYVELTTEGRQYLTVRDEVMRGSGDTDALDPHERVVTAIQTARWTADI